MGGIKHGGYRKVEDNKEVMLGIKLGGILYTYQ